MLNNKKTIDTPWLTKCSKCGNDVQLTSEHLAQQMARIIGERDRLKEKIDSLQKELEKKRSGAW